MYNRLLKPLMELSSSLETCNYSLKIIKIFAATYNVVDIINRCFGELMSQDLMRGGSDVKAVAKPNH